MRQGTPAGAGSELPDFDPSVPNPARVWNYWVGGKDHFAADRDAAERVLQVMPYLREIARASRRFQCQAVHDLAAAGGIRQFLDIGTGLPTADSTHEVAQRVAPDARVVYVDYDPVVYAYAQALLTSSPQGSTDYLQADLRDTQAILAGAAQTLDFSRPVAVLLLAVVHFIPDSDDPYGAVRRLMAAVASGSYLVMHHAASDIETEAVAEGARRFNRNASAQITPRNRQQVERFFDGLVLTGGALAPLSQWADRGAAVGLAGYCGIGRKP